MDSSSLERLLLWIDKALLGPVYSYCELMEVLKIHLDISYGDVEVNTELSELEVVCTRCENVPQLVSHGYCHCCVHG